MGSRIKVSYQGIIVTDQFLTVHFAVGNGSWMRHQTVKVPIAELLTDQVTQAIDRHVRRRMIEIWSEQSVPMLTDDLEESPWASDAEG